MKDKFKDTTYSMILIAVLQQQDAVVNLDSLPNFKAKQLHEITLTQHEKGVSIDVLKMQLILHEIHLEPKIKSHLFEKHLRFFL